MILYEEFELLKDHPFVLHLYEMLKWLKNSDVSSRVHGNERDDQWGKELLTGRMNGTIKCSKAHMARFGKEDGYDFEYIKKYAAKVYRNRTDDQKGVQVDVAKTWYPPKGYLGWHIDDDGGRFYSTWAEGESFFRYRHPDTGEIVTSWDKPKQWTFRIFTFDKNRPLWHCVYAKDLRISIGYKFVGG